MRSFQTLTRHLLTYCLCLLSVARAQDSYDDWNFPTPLLLKPGITQLTGGLTTPDQDAQFFYRTNFDGNVTVRLRYQHRTANFLQGITELPHLSGSLLTGYYSPPNYLYPGTGPGGAQLSSPFIIANSTNTISATIPAFYESSAATELRLSAPSSKTHPNYTVEFDYQPARDPWEAGGGNETPQTAYTIDPTTPGTLSGGTHGATDVDWFRFTVPPGRTLRLVVQSIQNEAPLPHQCVLHNALAIPLQTGSNGNVPFAENAGASGQTYLLRITSQDAYAQGWKIFWLLDDALEPNDNVAQAHALGILQPQGRIEVPELTLMDEDHYTVQSGLPAGTPFIIAALPDPGNSIHGGGRVLPTGGTTTSEELRNYAVVTTGTFGIVSFRVVGSVTGYRLLIKPRSAYDVWHKLVAVEVDALPPYLPAASDFDGDGIPAALEWALRLSPFTANPGAIPPPYLDGANWRVNIPMPQGGAAADIRVTESENLVNWTDFPSARTNLGGSVIPTGRTAGAVLTLSRPGSTKNFLRLGVKD